MNTDRHDTTSFHRTGWVIPTQALGSRPIPAQFRASDYQAQPYTLGPDNTATIRVGWPGTPGEPGSFDIKTADNWFSCQNLASDDPANDLIFPAQDIAGGEFRLAFERAPGEEKRAFQVRALPIDWNPGVTLPESADQGFVARRGDHYTYRDPVESIPWVTSDLSGGVQRVLLTLATGTDYEVWVNIQHPTDDTVWMPHDPVVRGISTKPG